MPFLLVWAVCWVLILNRLELILSPRNPFGGFSSWLVLCLGANPPCFRYLKETASFFNGFLNSVTH